MSNIQKRINEIKEEIDHISDNCNRETKPSLIAVSKYHSVESIIEAIKSGQKIFGENKVQEALNKFTEIKLKFPDIKLHMIGPLQTNKVKDVFSLFDVIQSVDRPKLVKEISKQQTKFGKKIDCFIQVNIGNEPQKAGVSPEDLDELISLCKNLSVPIIGLMCIPPIQGNPQYHFHKMKKLADRHHLKHLSMGMSSDYEHAIKEGATYIRVGTAIFGKRDQN